MKISDVCVPVRNETAKERENFDSRLGEKGRGLTLDKKLSYKGCLFHRVCKDFMIQSGDFTEGNRSSFVF